ncbi:MAG TPA: peptidoglycan-binding protein [Acidimicrobiales bacterium]|nr:peptidoglycan-binding protein [Acidimicrobiales bacterium]
MRQRVRRRIVRRGIVVLLVVVVSATAAGAWGLLRSGSPPRRAAVEPASSLATITERTITARQQVDGTLGFAGATSVLQPVGTAPDAVAQAEEKASAAELSLVQAWAERSAAEATLADDSRILASDRARLSADKQKEAGHCQDADAAGGSSGNGTGGSGAGWTPCDGDRQAVAADQKEVDADVQKVSADHAALTRAQANVVSGEQSSAFARSAADDVHRSSLAFGQTSIYTMLPAIGQILTRGQPLFSISGQPVALLYGSVTPWRAFRAGMSAGPDVAELNQSLADLGHGAALAGSDRFGNGTAAAIRKLQRALGSPQTGELLLGSVVFEPGPVRVTAVLPKLGAAVQPGAPVLDVTSTTRQISVKLDAAQQSQVEVGDPVVITLPDKKTTPATVTAVAKVATEPPSPDAGAESSGQPTVDVVITPDDSAATGNLDAAPVQVSITTASVEHALGVPVTALLALSGGGYGVDVVPPGGVHHLEPVTLGLFDDAEGLVQISGANVRAGDHVAVASS